MSESTLELRAKVTAIFAFSSAGKPRLSSKQNTHQITKRLVLSLGTLRNSFNCFLDD